MNSVMIGRNNGFSFTLKGYADRVEMLSDAALVALDEVRGAFLRNPIVELVYHGDPYEVNMPVLKNWTNNRGGKTALMHYERYIAMLGDPEHVIVVKERV
jgi:hypothetical protein